MILDVFIFNVVLIIHGNNLPREYNCYFDDSNEQAILSNVVSRYYLNGIIFKLQQTVAID